MARKKTKSRPRLRVAGAKTARPGRVTTPFGLSHTELAVAISAATAKVWRALFEETDKWWPRSFCMAQPPQSLRSFRIEARLGGRMYEDWGDGAGLVWAQVIGLDPGRSVLFQGALTGSCGGPGITFIEFKLTPAGGGTNLRVSDTAFGRILDGHAASVTDGWKLLLEGALKRYVEGA